jgi:uncharacterized protein YjiS (DUF1127 family)
MSSPIEMLSQDAPKFRLAPTTAPDFRGLMTRLLDVTAAWAERQRQRRILAALDDRMLADIGLDRAALSPEEAKLFGRL